MTGSFSTPFQPLFDTFRAGRYDSSQPGNSGTDPLLLPPGPPFGSDFEQIPFLGGQHLVDLGDVMVGNPLEVLLLAAEVIFGDLALALQVLHLVLHVAPDVADGNPALLRPLTSHPDQFLAPVLGEGREAEPDDGPVVGGVDAKLRGGDGLLDGAESVAVVR